MSLPQGSDGETGGFPHGFGNLPRAHAVLIAPPNLHHTVPTTFHSTVRTTPLLGMPILHIGSIRLNTTFRAHQYEFGLSGVCFAEQSPLWFHLVGQFRSIHVADHLVRPERMDDPVGSQV